MRLAKHPCTVQVSLHNVDLQCQLSDEQSNADGRRKDLQQGGHDVTVNGV